MRTDYNGSAFDAPSDGFATVGQVLDACEAARSDGRVLVRVCVDGSDVAREDWDALRARPCREVDHLELEARSADELARTSLAYAADYCDPVCAAIAETAEHLRAGRSAEGLSLYAQLLDALTVLVETLAAAGAALDAPTPFLEEAGRELQPWLEALLEAQGKDDRLLIADYLEYEIAPVVSGWSRRLRARPGAQAQEVAR